MNEPTQHPSLMHTRRPDNHHGAHPHYPSEKARPSTTAKWAAFLEAEIRKQFPVTKPKETTP